MATSWSYLELIRDGSDLSGHWIQYLDLLRSLLVLHNTTRSPAGSWRYGEGMTSSWAYVELMRNGSDMPGLWIQYMDLHRSPHLLHNTTR